MWTIEPAGPADADPVRALGEALFAEVGEIGRLLPRFLANQGVTTFLAREGGQALGLVMFGFLPWSQLESDEAWLAELLALGVRADHRRRGLGRALFERLLQVVEEMSTWREVRAIQAVCPGDAPGVLAFLRQAGFRVQDRAHGRYSDGRPAWRLTRPVSMQRA